MPERLELIREVNQPSTHTVVFTSPISVEDFAMVSAAMQDVNQLRSRETAAHALVTSLLLSWLSQATGVSKGEIITRLALTIDRLHPADEPGR
jgi:hypothetical protein